MIITATHSLLVLDSSFWSHDGQGLQTPSIQKTPNRHGYMRSTTHSLAASGLRARARPMTRGSRSCSCGGSGCWSACERECVRERDCVSKREDVCEKTRLHVEDLLEKGQHVDDEVLVRVPRRVGARHVQLARLCFAGCGFGDVR